MIINKTHSKTDLIELINDIGLPIVFSHQDNKRDIQAKYHEMLKKSFPIKHNFYKIETIDGLKNYLENTNPKKTLSIKEKQNVMLLCKHIINYCKNGYDIGSSKLTMIFILLVLISNRTFHHRRRKYLTRKCPPIRRSLL